MNEIIFPIQNVLKLDGLCLCINCGKLFMQAKDTRDHGICSLSCGYQIRGLSSNDFMTTNNQFLSQSFVVNRSFASDFVEISQ